MEIRVYECPKEGCRYRWVPRVESPKECPNCKHRFTADWGLKPKVSVVKVHSKEEKRALLDKIKKWNEKGRWE